MAAHSPATSPRLPSPPPIAEDQLGPTSPGVPLFEDHGKFPNSTVDHNAARRIRPGTKASEMAEGPPLIDLSDIDSAFPLTEHLKALHYHHTHPPSDPNTTQPITAEIAKQLSTPPTSNTSREIWLYELGRFLIQKTNAIIVALFSDSPPCSFATCPEMRASEWQYLCAVHDPPKNCSAIDYCCHTLDWAATTLTSSKMFPSRLGLGSGTATGGAGGAPGDKMLQQQMKELTNIFRRVYRIYAHAWFQHREMFWRVESKTGLYVFFKTVCDEYGLIQPENYTIPAQAEGLEPDDGGASAAEKSEEVQIQGPTILRRDVSASEAEGQAEEQQPNAQDNVVLAAGETQKRHRHLPGERASSVSTIIQEEVEEEDEESQPQRHTEQEEHGRESEQAIHGSKFTEIPESLPQPGQQHQQSEPREETSHATHVQEESHEEGTEHEAPAADNGAEEEISLGIRRSDTVKPPRESIHDVPPNEEENEEHEVEARKVESVEEGHTTTATVSGHAHVAEAEESVKPSAD